MPQTGRGIIYPDSSGHTRLWEHLGSLAQSADDAIGGLLPIPRVRTGVANVPGAGGLYTSAAVTFPAGSFTVAPHVVACGTHNAGWYWATVSGVTVNGFSVTLRGPTSGPTSGQTFGAEWIAIQT